MKLRDGGVGGRRVLEHVQGLRMPALLRQGCTQIGECRVVARSDAQHVAPLPYGSLGLAGCCIAQTEKVNRIRVEWVDRQYLLTARRGLPWFPLRQSGLSQPECGFVVGNGHAAMIRGVM